MKVTKVMRYQINKPINMDWKTFHTHLSQMQYDIRRIKNKTIQYFWEFQSRSFDQHDKHGEYLKPRDITGYKTLDGYVYKQLKSYYDYLHSDTIGSAIRDAKLIVFIST